MRSPCESPTLGQADRDGRHRRHLNRGHRGRGCAGRRHRARRRRSVPRLRHREDSPPLLAQPVVRRPVAIPATVPSRVTGSGSPARSRLRRASWMCARASSHGARRAPPASASAAQLVAVSEISSTAERSARARRRSVQSRSASSAPPSQSSEVAPPDWEVADRQRGLERRDQVAEERPSGPHLALQFRASERGPAPYQDGNPMRVCTQAKTQGIARRSPMSPRGERAAGREAT